MTQDNATVDENSEAFVYVLLAEDELYCDWCKAPLAFMSLRWWTRG